MNIKNSKGLVFNFLENGSIRSIEAGPVRISLSQANAFSKSGANLYLRKRGNLIAYVPLLGPESNSRFCNQGETWAVEGTWEGLDYRCTLQLSDKSLSWQWIVAVTNASDKAVQLDLVYLQDAGLKQATNALTNEYYVSQYLERRILEDNHYGSVICCRQNMEEQGGHPWLMIAAKNGGFSGSVDGMQFYGNRCRETGVAEGLLADTLGGEYAGESSMLALQEKPFSLAPGGQHQCSFLGTFLADHPLATSTDDLKLIPGIFQEFGDLRDPEEKMDFTTPITNLFNTTPFFAVEDLTDQNLDLFFGAARRFPEAENGNLHAFFTDHGHHVVLRAKEQLADRPHAHIMQAFSGSVPDENIVSTTAFMSGIFNSHLTQGNTNFNILLSVCASQFNLTPETGQRILVEVNGQTYLLGVPSAFEIGLNHCRWIYLQGDICFQVRTWTSRRSPQVFMDFKVLNGNPVNLLITHQFDPLNRWKVFPGTHQGEYFAHPDPGTMITEKFPSARFSVHVHSDHSNLATGGDEILYGDQKSRGDHLFILDVKETKAFCMSITGEVISKIDPARVGDPDARWLSDYHDSSNAWNELSLNLSLISSSEDASAISQILPWYGMNALTHFLTPYGLEQFSGAAWGTRDIAQGPFDLLLCMEKYTEARKVLCIIFSNQNPDGGWPQWWMFDSYSHIRADSSHGDIFYWCILALGNYIKVTGDVKILEEVLPYYHQQGVSASEQTPLSEHVDRLINMIINSFIPGTSLVPFGGGDWNDSLQPVSAELARRMISSWTVEMNYQAFAQYSKVFELSGQPEKARKLNILAEQIKSDFNQHLVKDGVVGGYGLVGEGGSISLLLHPGDQETNIHYSLLPMNRGIISGIFSPEQAQSHQELIEKHLMGPDGARLMDRPLRYRGGIQTIFQRAESSTFFGREIGLMYVHEHIRYAESQAILGRADAFVKALRQANPVAYRNIVSCGDIRQSNCYYSSSDVAFKNRYEADDKYDQIKTGAITLKGGWRVYSSGPGIYISLVITRLLGWRVTSEAIIIDPVMPRSMDGMEISLKLLGHTLSVKYLIREDCFGPKSISINGKSVPFAHEVNEYRKGGAIVPAGLFTTMLDQLENVVEITI